MEENKKYLEKEEKINLDEKILLKHKNEKKCTNKKY
jgi:hypothetical protein